MHKPTQFHIKQGQQTCHLMCDLSVCWVNGLHQLCSFIHFHFQEVWVNQVLVKTKTPILTVIRIAVMS